MASVRELREYIEARIAVGERATAQAIAECDTEGEADTWTWVRWDRQQRATLRALSAELRYLPHPTGVRLLTVLASFWDEHPPLPDGALDAARASLYGKRK